MVAVAFQLIVRWCWAISCERFFKACRSSQNYDVILGYSKTNQRTSCITYIHNIYLQWYLQQNPKLFLYHPHETDRCDLPRQSPKPESRSPDLPSASSPSSLYQSTASKVFAIASATILVQGPPSAFSSSCSSNRNKGNCSSGGGSGKGNSSSTSNTSIVAASAAAATAAWQSHGAYQTRPRSVHV